ncbi:MAG: hypothetical protein QN178_17620, partial [Armatimonadota bacterium]|nr:hypothetical protein [Armatimonadota bacterium]
ANPDNLRTPFSTRNARCDFKQGGGGCFFSYDAAAHPKWFVQYWVMLAANWRWGTSTYGGNDDGLSNVKFMRFFPLGARNYSNVGYAFHGFAGKQTTRFVEIGPSQSLPINLEALLAPGSWHLIQVEFAENSGVDRADGRLRLWIDGQIYDDTRTLVTNIGTDGPAVNKRPFIIGLFDSWPPSDAPVANMFGYYADIYVDNTFARVEIGDAPRYDDCTHREIQYPLSWDPGAISIRVNQGAFAAGQAAYVFVVDDGGRVNPVGFPITFGGQTVPPPAPSLPVWQATVQTGDAVWKDSAVTYCVRLLIQGQYITQTTGPIRLAFRGRSAGSYTIRKVSIAERDVASAEGNVVDSTWTRVVFDGRSASTWNTDAVTVQAGSEKLSDWIPFTLRAGRDYYVTFKIDTPSVYLNPPSTYRELYFPTADMSEVVDWAGTGYAATRDYHALAAIYAAGSNPTAPSGLRVIP